MSNGMFEQTNSYLDNLKRDYQFGGIAWLYMWDIIRDTYNEIDQDHSAYDCMPVPGTTLEDVYNKFYNDTWGGFDVDQSDVVNWLSAEDLIQEWTEDEENG
jgi:hypothetical protein